MTSTADRGASATEIDFLTVLEAGCPRSRCHQGLMRALSWGEDGCLLPVISAGREKVGRGEGRGEGEGGESERN